MYEKILSSRYGKQQKQSSVVVDAMRKYVRSEIKAVNQTPLTKGGAERLRQEVEVLKKDRVRISASIAEARAHGDLSENAEYHAAREQQGFAEARIRQIEQALAGAPIIDVTRLNANGRVVFGSTVQLRGQDKKKIVYQIVGEAEADIGAGRISVISPVARAMIGKIQGDVIDVQTQSGVVRYEILDVRYE